MVGNTLGHYEILELLGAGGMGEVYRARDVKLDREIALKVLPAALADDPARLERFQREAKAIAALSHPNIVMVHSVEEHDGTHFLTMELIEGKTLDALIPEGGMGIDALLEIGAPLAEAIAAAHERGIVHRDLKPANIMVAADNRVKVLDFGLAKLQPASGEIEATALATEAWVTQDGLVVGTIPYMSPEQVEGKRLDHRTDIFSLGVLLYEMATGTRPFRGDTQPALMSSILRDAPPQILEVRSDLPRHLGRILNRCLEKDPQRRYQRAASLLYELEGLSKEHDSGAASMAPPGPASHAPAPVSAGAPLPGSGSVEAGAGSLAPRPTGETPIAVLPFLNRSNNPDDQYFVDGLSEELINALGRLPGIRVTARSSAFQFRGQELDVREVGRKLGVEAVLEGSVRIVGERLRITAELVNCADGCQTWSDRFDGEMKDIFDTQDEIVQSIVEHFEVELDSKDDRAVVKRGTENLEAYHLLLKARHHGADLLEPGLVKAIECLEQAVVLDPEYGLAYADMAFYYLMRSIFGALSGKEAFPQVRAQAVRALELDPKLGEAHSNYGIYLAWHDLDWEAAEKELRRALELSPENVWSHFSYAAVLSTARRVDDIVPHVRKMAALDPLNPFIRAHVALFLFYADRVEEAITEVEEALELFPEYWLLYYTLSFFRFHQRDGDAAIACMRKAIEMTDGQIGFIQCYLASICFYFGDQAEGERWMARVEELSTSNYVSPLGYFWVEIARGNTDDAIAWLERGRAEHDTLFVWTRAYCEMQGLIIDERIRQAMERLGLP